MPIYQYQCSECGHQLEALQKMSDPKLTDCPQCQASALRKQLTAAAFKLKGTGWYETDFKNSGRKQEKTKAAESQSDGNATSASADTEATSTTDVA